jgi:hypothetical protein
MPTDLPFPDNSTLLTLLRDWGKRTPGDHADVYERLLASTLVIAAGTQRDDHGNFQPIVVTLQNQAFVASFTDKQSFRAMFPPDAAVQAIHIPARELCSAVAQDGPDGIAVNPAGPIAFAVTREQCQSLAKGRVRNEEGMSLDVEDAEVMVGRPVSPMPEALRERLLRALGQTSVRRVLWCWIKYGENEKQHLAFGVAPADQATIDAVGKAIGVEREHLAALMPAGGKFMVLPLSGDLGKIIEEAGAPLYESS